MVLLQVNAPERSMGHEMNCINMTRNLDRRCFDYELSAAVNDSLLNGR